MDKVSVLIPCYNVELFLPYCLDSILNQSYENLQISLIDDGSKDATWEVMQKYAEIDSRIEIYHQDNKGVAYTRNRLLEKIKGEFVLFVDSDDWIEPDMVEFLVDRANQYEADVVTCGMVINDSAPSPIYTETLLDRTETVKKFLFHKDLKGSLWNKLIKTSLLHNLSFDDAIGYGEDALFCWQFLQRIDKAVLTKKQLYHYRMNQSSISHSAFGKQKLSGHIVWNIITKDTEEMYPEFSDIAYGHKALEDMYLLRDASQRFYPYDSNIKEIQKAVRRNIQFARKTNQVLFKDMFYAFCITRWYNFGKLYKALHSVKQVLKK